MGQRSTIDLVTVLDNPKKMKVIQKINLPSLVSIILLGYLFLFGNSKQALACSGIPLKGNYALSANCTLGGSLIGVAGNLDLYTNSTGYQLTILNGQTARYTGSINIGNGYISIANGGIIENKDTYVVDSDGDGWATGFNTQTGANIYADAAAGRISRLSTLSNTADYNDANASIQTYSYAYAQAWYYTYSQAWYYTYSQAWYYGYGQSWYYGYGQSDYWRYSQGYYYGYGQGRYWRYSQNSYGWRKAI